VRNSDTTVRLKDGQSFAIAGLLSDATRNVVRKVPGLGEIPILGALFRSNAFQREETELLVVIRADLVQPISKDVPSLPGEDEIFDPDDFMLFMMGKVDGVPKKDKGKRKTGQRSALPEMGAPSGPIGFVRQ
jgi:pilus assembly protein CpaC